MQALIERAYSLGRLTESQRRYFYVQFSQHGYRMQEPIPLEREQPKIHQQMLDVHIHDLGYDVGKFARLFSMSPKYIRELYFPSDDGNDADTQDEPTLRLLK